MGSSGRKATFSGKRMMVGLLGAWLAVGSAWAEEVDLHGDEGILFWPPEQQVTGYRAIDRIYNTRQVEAGDQPYPLTLKFDDFSAFRYRHDGLSRTLDEYMESQRIAGLIAVRDGRVRLERYGLGNNADNRWISFSIAKSVVSMLIGAAVQDGYIESLDDLVVDYLPRLRGGVYDEVSIRHILQMSSGVVWNEDYADPESDTAQAPGGGMALLRYMRGLPRSAPPGVQFNYNTGETSIAGSVLRAAIGNNLTTYLSYKIWRPFGMEADASWLIDQPGGHEYGGCCINATLRDYARIGLFALSDGVIPGTGRRVLPPGWMRQSVTPSPAYPGYGYYWWLMGEGVYAGLGIFGQMIWVDPTRKIVIAQHAAWPNAGDDELRAHRAALISALADAL